MARRLTEAELLEFLFLPGFSTKEAVTEISGRGVGLDVVQDMVKSVGGLVRVTSKPGRGTRFTLQLPITMSVIRALLVKIAGEPYAFPLNRIDRIVRVARDEVRRLEGRPHFLLDDHLVGLVDAVQVLDLPGSGGGADPMPVVVVSDRGARFGMIVDEFLGERDLEVRPLDPRLGKPPDINSASVLDDGWPVLIVDVEDLVRSIDNLLGGKRLKAMAGPALARRRRRSRPGGSWSWTTRSPSASWSGSSWRAGGTPSTWRSTASMAGTRCGWGIIIWSSATLTCPGWTGSAWSARSSRTPG